MKHAWLVVALLVPLLASCSDDGTPWERAPCEPARPQPTGTHTLTLDDGREAALYVPEGYDGTEAQPLVFSWHGYGSNAADHLAYADFRPLADDDDFIVVVPQGAGSPTRFDLGEGIVGDTDDVAFAHALIDRLSADYCVDAQRIYSVGVSNGGGMSAVLACRSDRFAAIGMDALLLRPAGCTAATSVLGMMGDADLVVPFQGGDVNCCDPGWTLPAAEDTMRAWAEAASCGDADEDDVEDHVERTRWSDCDGGVEVEYWVIRGGGHTWPGAPDTSQLGPTNQEIDASEVFWDFFKQHSLDRA